MNCEKCKNTKATVFYADDAGGRHALCATCAAALGKASQYSPTQTTPPRQTPFIPEPTLLSLLTNEVYLPSYCSYNDSAESAICPSCRTSLASIISRGEVGCPECYTVFGDSLFPTSLTPESASGARMPTSRRDDIDRIRSINDLRSRIKLAVETENYELAASLRDEVRRLESGKRS